MNHTDELMTKVFNEWAKRFSEKPDDFHDVLGADGKPIDDYGQRCTAYFRKLSDEILDIDSD